MTQEGTNPTSNPPSPPKGVIYSQPSKTSRWRAFRRGGGSDRLLGPVRPPPPPTVGNATVELQNALEHFTPDTPAFNPGDSGCTKQPRRLRPKSRSIWSSSRTENQDPGVSGPSPETFLEGPDTLAQSPETNSRHPKHLAKTKKSVGGVYGRSDRHVGPVRPPVPGSETMGRSNLRGRPV